MKLKTCKNIEIFLLGIRFIVVLALSPIKFFGWAFLKIFDSIDYLIEEGIWALSNKMLRKSDEVKNGTIKNKEAIRDIGSLTAWKRLELD